MHSRASAKPIPLHAPVTIAKVRAGRLLSIAGAATSSELMVTINNLYYFGMTQFLPGMLGVLFLDRMRPGAIIAGIIAGDVVAIAIFELAIPVGGINAGFIGLLVNLGIVFMTLLFSPGLKRLPIAAIGQTR